MRHFALCLLSLLSLVLSACTPATLSSSSRSANADTEASAKSARAKNVILFIGDGMSLDTVTAARILSGQLQGLSGEEQLLSFETLPYTALSKVYNTNQQVPDSAGTATAMLSGEKTLAGVIGVGPTTVRGNCASAMADSLETLVESSERHGLASGVVSTARITHATPAAAFAHSADRNWENDGVIPDSERNCEDIATQLINFSHGDGIDIVLGGGSAQFTSAEQGGYRKDGQDLLAQWQSKHKHMGVLVRNATELKDAVMPPSTEQATLKKVFGVFHKSHMSFEVDRVATNSTEPSLTEMTTAAIQHLQGAKNGYFLLVEAGRIDHAHHMGNAARALLETIEFSNAIAETLKAVSLTDTLVVVTADHGHTMSMGGYATRGNPILGKVIENGPDGQPLETVSLDDHGKPFTTLSYANGPGATTMYQRDLSTVDTDNIDFIQSATVPLKNGETHSGTDVPIYAAGPGSQRFHGVLEQHRIYHIMKEALALPVLP